MIIKKLRVFFYYCISDYLEAFIMMKIKIMKKIDRGKNKTKICIRAEVNNNQMYQSINIFSYLMAEKTRYYKKTFSIKQTFDVKTFPLRNSAIKISFVIKKPLLRKKTCCKKSLL